MTKPAIRLTALLALLTLTALAGAQTQPADDGDISGETPRFEAAPDEQQPDDAQQDQPDEADAGDPNASDPTEADPNAPAGPDDGGNWLQDNFFFIMIGGVILMMLLMGRKPRKEAKKREEMLSNLKKGDRITTIGGIVGTIMEIKDQEITIKVDESTNARMRVARWSVRDIGTPTEQAQSEEKKK